MTLLVGMVADDLTGALDAAAPFATRGLATLVLLSSDGETVFPDDTEVACINTASREITPDAAAARVAKATRLLAPAKPRLWFKKVDSRLKGHLAVETSAMLASAGLSQVLAAPAIPEFGRLVVDGAICGMGIANPIAVAPALAGLPITVPDTPDQAAMDLVAEEAEAAAATTLAVGARGLAQAMANRLPARAAPESALLPRPLLIAIGSRDPITRAQVDDLVAAFAPQRILAPNGAVPEAACEAGIVLITTELGDREEPGATVAERFAMGVARLVRRAPPATLLLSGGETAYVILRELGVTSIRLRGEALPGVPFASAEIGGEQVVILTKSGGFGDVETISLLAASHETLE
jgi:uncharacterized protein YgbK (DUF1537 family)